MSFLKPLAVAAAVALAVAACSKPQQSADESATLPPATDAAATSSMSAQAPTTVNPTGTGVIVGDGSAGATGSAMGTTGGTMGSTTAPPANPGGGAITTTTPK